MNLVFTKKADKDYKRLPLSIQRKADKQFAYLLQDYHYPSLRIKKMSTGKFEGRVNYQYRFTFEIEDKNIFILTVGPHDEGLGKK